MMHDVYRSAIWHTILYNFRPVSVWGTDLLIFYVITGGSFGEAWTPYSWLQLFGTLVREGGRGEKDGGASSNLLNARSNNANDGICNSFPDFRRDCCWGVSCNREGASAGGMEIGPEVCCLILVLIFS